MILRGMIVYDYALTLEFCGNGSPGAIPHQGEAWDVRYHGNLTWSIIKDKLQWLQYNVP